MDKATQNTEAQNIEVQNTETKNTNTQETHKSNPITGVLHNIPDVLNNIPDVLHTIQKQALTAMSTLTSSMASISTSVPTTPPENSWYQPFPDYKGTVVGKENYTKEIAKEDALKLRRAMRGLGVDKATIVEISGNRTFQQRQMIVKEFVDVDEREKRDLLRDLKNDVGGDLENLVLPLYMIPGEYDARLLEKAMHSIGNDVEVLNEILCTRTNKEIHEMKLAWTQKVDINQKLEERVSDETKKFFGITHYHILCMKLLEARRPPCAEPDDKQVRADAEELNRILKAPSAIQNPEAKFIEIFTERSWTHIRALVKEFQNVSKKWTLDGAICHEFGVSSNTVKALRLLISFCSNPYNFWAKGLRDALKGAGTDNSKLTRIIVSRCEVDLHNIIEVFDQRYGKGRNLKNWIEQDCSGYYAQLLLYLCGY